jgi:hypothetical protein
MKHEQDKKESELSTYHTSGDVDLATVRLNYRWGGPVVARY